jgi:2-methylisocitrate lyase-like PEP mutase family enzyme
MSRLGTADLGVATMNDMRDHAAMIASIDPAIPLIADADTGYGGMCLSLLSKLCTDQTQDH